MGHTFDQREVGTWPEPRNWSSGVSKELRESVCVRRWHWCPLLQLLPLWTNASVSFLCSTVFFFYCSSWFWVGSGLPCDYVHQPLCISLSETIINYSLDSLITVNASKLVVLRLEIMIRFRFWNVDPSPWVLQLSKIKYRFYNGGP